MKQIESQALLGHIRPQRLCYFTEYMDLLRPDEIESRKIKCFANQDETCFAMTWAYPEWNTASFIGYDKNFTRVALRQFDETEACWSLPPGEVLPSIQLRGLKK